MLTVRTVTPEDAAAIAAIRAESWQAAYAGIIAPDVLARFTSQEAIEQRADAMRRNWPSGMLLAESVSPGGPASPGCAPHPGGTGGPGRIPRSARRRAGTAPPSET
jgi:hypothetical protein